MMMPVIEYRHYAGYAPVKYACYNLHQAVTLAKEILERRYSYEYILIRNGRDVLWRFDGVSKSQAKNFFADVCGTFHTGGNDLIMSAEDIAEAMGITVRQAKKYLRACANHKITERQGGGWVI